MNSLHKHKSYLAFVGHRLSGVALAVFLPFHFLLLGSSIGGADALQRSLQLVDNPLFRIAEWGLVVCLSLHMLFGMRLLLLEFTRWPTGGDSRLGWIIPALLASLFVGVVFMFQSAS